MLKTFTWVALAVVAVMSYARLADAQISPTPGPTNPAPAPNSLAKPGSDLVINPTPVQCKEGWRPGLKWTRQQFETFCTDIRTSK